MKKSLFTKRLALLGLASLLAVSAGCTTGRSVPVREKNPPSPRTKAPSTTVTRQGEHVVQPGETLYAISRRYGVPVQNLIAWNNLTRPGQLEVGQTLKVTPPGAVPENTETFAVDAVSPSPVISLPPVVKYEPRGGKEAYSDEAWARVQGQSATPNNALSDTPSFSSTSSTPPAASEAPRPGSAAASGDWIWPVKGDLIGRFGEGNKRNMGIDIAGAPGTPILAAAGGKVVYAGSGLRGLGKLVIIKHNDDYLTAYAHNRVILVKEADTVARGQKIAELGNTDTDQPKLHFELRKQGQPVDPLKYLPAL
ncbi:MAG: peptidoglycan DD-metalloendopeptidase family protein [Azoarcus sp.]|jgi:lipoprotein NlpD|nr:peptidoglycan DD-metalloendopeptidase family protein [Azoarcus sp.]